MFVPDREEFCARAAAGNLVPVYREILADRLTPVSAYERLTADDRDGNSFLLESVEGGERVGRYSFLGSDPSIIFRCRGRQGRIWENGSARDIELAANEDPLTVLQDLMERYTYVESADLPRFCGGAVGFFGYDVVRFFEDLPDNNPDELEFDDACFLLTDTLLLFDHVRHRVKVICNAHVLDGGAPAAYDAAVERIDQIVARLRCEPHAEAYAPPVGAPAVKVEACFPREQYEASVERCRDYILDGDAFQIVLSQRFKVPVTAPSFDIYRALRSVNPSPYMYFISVGTRKLIGTSPEILVTVEQKAVRVRPIAGTRPRGKCADEDGALEVELQHDAKERAEHIMLVDLGRNDIGRVCEFGSVELDQLMVTERYSHVMHLVSNVTGRLAGGRSVYDVFRACFPAGTVSGAPKVRAMEIIDELEPVRRGFYAGAVGYFSYSGDMDMAIAIRTMLVDRGVAYLQSGGGIVADSSPQNEYQECVNKARALVHAIELAEAGLE